MFWPRKEKRFTPKKRQLRRIRDSIILNNRACSEVWSYGDCQCMVGGQLHREIKEVDRLLSELRAFVVWSEKKAQKGDKRVLEQIARNDASRAAVQPFIEKQLWFENKSGAFGYPVLNGFNYAADLVKVQPVPNGAEVRTHIRWLSELCRTLADMASGYLRIFDKNQKTYIKLDGTPGTDKETHFKIKKREEMQNEI